MKPAFSMKIEGGKIVEAYLNSTSDSIRSNIKKTMTQIKGYMIGQVKSSIAGHQDEVRRVDTGNYMSSITGYSDDTGAVIASDVEYANFVEQGTSKMVPGRHFQNSLARNNDKINEFIDTSVKEVINGKNK